MAIIRWNPFGNVTVLQERINRMFDEAFSRGRNLEENLAIYTWKPEVDVYESEEGIVIEADLPGVSKDQIYIEVTDNVLTLHGERTLESEIPETQYYRKERCCGSFHRSFSLPFQVDPIGVTARFKDGVLIVRIVRPPSEKPWQVQIPID